MKFLIYQFSFVQTVPSLFNFPFYAFHPLTLNFLKSFPTFQFFGLFPIFVDSIAKNNYLSSFFSIKEFFSFQLIDFKNAKNVMELIATNF